MAVDAIVVALISIAAGYRLWGPGVVDSADGLFHLYRAFALDRAIGEGLLFPRLLPDLLYGYAYPLFNFYPPGATYLLALLHWLGLGFVAALTVAFALSFVFSALGMYAFARLALAFHFQAGGSALRGAAVLASATYVVSPYLLIDVYTRGALGEALVAGLVPILMLAVHKAATGGRFAFTASALVAAAVVLTHSALALFVLPLAVAYGALVALSARRDVAPALLRTLLSIIWALGLTAFFWLPAWLERGSVGIGNIESGFYDIKNNFLSWQSLISSDLIYPRSLPLPIPPRLGPWQALLAAAGIIITLAAWRAANRSRGGLGASWPHSLLRAASFFVSLIALAAFTLFLITPAGAWLWDLAPLLAGFSFPWRLLALTSLALALLAALIPLGVPGRMRSTVTLLAIVATLAFSLPGIDPGRRTMREDDVNLASYWRSEFSTSMVGTTSANEYVPVTLRPGSYALPRVPEDAYRPVSQRAASAPDMQLLEAGPLRFRVKITSPAPTELIAHAVYFPGWAANVDGQAATVLPDSSLGLASVPVPAGEHEVSLHYDQSAVARFAQYLSLAALLAVALLLLSRLHPGLPFRKSRAAPVAAAFVLAALAVWWPRQDSPVQPLHNVMLNDEVGIAGWQPAVQSGSDLRLKLHWLARKRPARNEVAVMTLRDSSGGEVQSWERHPTAGYSPTLRWLAGEIIPDELALPIAGSIATGKYNLSLNLRSGSTLVDLGSVEVKQAVQSTVPPAQPVPDYPLDLSVGDSIRLLGYRLAPQGEAGANLEVILFWRSEKVVDRDFTIFLHLTDDKGERQAGHDSQPQNGDMPTLLWQPPDVIIDPHSIQLPPGLPSGRYHLLLGAYTRPDMARLPIKAGGNAKGDRMELGLVDIR